MKVKIMRFAKLWRLLIILILIAIPIGLFLQYLPINLDDESVIDDEYRLVNAFPNLSFNKPVDLQNPKDGTNLLYVVEQAGRIMVFENKNTIKDQIEFLDITDRVRDGGEMGLLGLAFHPNYQINGKFYVDYTMDNPRRTIISQ
jgi:hypothetical protein